MDLEQAIAQKRDVGEAYDGNRDYDPDGVALANTVNGP